MANLAKAIYPALVSGTLDRMIQETQDVIKGEKFVALHPEYQKTYHLVGEELLRLQKKTAAAFKKIKNGKEDTYKQHADQALTAAVTITEKLQGTDQAAKIFIQTANHKTEVAQFVESASSDFRSLLLRKAVKMQLEVGTEMSAEKIAVSMPEGDLRDEALIDLIEIRIGDGELEDLKKAVDLIAKLQSRNYAENKLAEIVSIITDEESAGDKEIALAIEIVRDYMEEPDDSMHKILDFFIDKKSLSRALDFIPYFSGDEWIKAFSQIVPLITTEEEMETLFDDREDLVSNEKALSLMKPIVLDLIKNDKNALASSVVKVIARSFHIENADLAMITKALSTIAMACIEKKETDLALHLAAVIARSPFESKINVLSKISMAFLEKKEPEAVVTTATYISEEVDEENGELITNTILEICSSLIKLGYRTEAQEVIELIETNSEFLIDISTTTCVAAYFIGLDLTPQAVQCALNLLSSDRSREEIASGLIEIAIMISKKNQPDQMMRVAKYVSIILKIDQNEAVKKIALHLWKEEFDIKEAVKVAVMIPDEGIRLAMIRKISAKP